MHQEFSCHLLAADCDTSFEFACDDRQCVYSSDDCDGEFDCADGSDEDNCGGNYTES